MKHTSNNNIQKQIRKQMEDTDKREQIQNTQYCTKQNLPIYSQRTSNSIPETKPQ